MQDNKAGRSLKFSPPDHGFATDSHLLLTIILIYMQMVLMIICICNRINETAARAAVKAGARSPKAVLAHNGCRFNCGKCKCEMGNFISYEMDKNPENSELVAAE